jgi:hypothetical protein
VVDGDIAVLRGLGGHPLRLGVSVGCGDGTKEMTLLRSGVVERFVLYEVAEARIANGMANAAKWNLSDRVEFRREIVNFAAGDPTYDLVYWNNALHHMLDTARPRWPGAGACSMPVGFLHQRLRRSRPHAVQR